MGPEEKWRSERQREKEIDFDSVNPINRWPDGSL
jgi:hypothetical protein